MPNQFLSPEGDLENYFITEYWLIDQYVGDTLWTWGLNFSSPLGTNDGNQRCTPVTTFVGGTNWKQISTGFYSTAAIKTDGTLWTWGDNQFGQLGNGFVFSGPLYPAVVSSGATTWKQVSGGESHTAAIKTDGTLWTWGRNNRGQLGNNTITNKLTPTQTLNGGTNWKQVACGGYHTVAIKTDGTLWTWGLNNYGQLGINDINSRTTPVQTFLGGTNWKQVSCGRLVTAAIKTDGTLWTWGRNQYGQLGINDAEIERSIPVVISSGATNWKQVSCGGYHTTAIKTDGTLWTWGRNSYGQLGINNTTTPICTPVQTFTGGTNWKQVAGGGQHTVAIKTDGTLWTWGRGSNGALGTNNTTDRYTPVQTFIGGTNWKQVSCGYNYTAAVTSGTDPTYFIS